jgi:hypothetical protein
MTQSGRITLITWTLEQVTSISTFVGQIGLGVNEVIRHDIIVTSC